MNQQQKKSDYDVYRLCREMRAMNSRYTNSVKFTNGVIVGKSLLNIDENMKDTTDNYILSFVVDSNNLKNK
uniref:Uncharacterized protein n=1 Tax=viral metagenome TaxID=1070528 RepID=A0A6C0CX72_9ZZZZ